jgi:hypothetical protein
MSIPESLTISKPLVCHPEEILLPSDIWIKIFSGVEPLPPDFCHWRQLWGYENGAKNIRFWLQCRTVSKIWHFLISKMDFSRFVTSKVFDFFEEINMNVSRLIQLFKFSCVSLRNTSIQLNWIRDVKSLSITDYTFQVGGTESFPELTNLRELTIIGRALPQKILLQLTNLVSLNIALAPEIHTIHTLTNLDSLTLLDHWTHVKKLHMLTNLQTLSFDRGYNYFDAHSQKRFSWLSKSISSPQA